MTWKPFIMHPELLISFSTDTACLQLHLAQKVYPQQLLHKALPLVCRGEFAFDFAVSQILIFVVTDSTVYAVAASYHV